MAYTCPPDCPGCRADREHLARRKYGELRRDLMEPCWSAEEAERKIAAFEEAVILRTRDGSRIPPFDVTAPGPCRRCVGLNLLAIQADLSATKAERESVQRLLTAERALTAKLKCRIADDLLLAEDVWGYVTARRASSKTLRDASLTL